MDVKPNGVGIQVEGGVIQAMSWCMNEEVTLDRSIVGSHDRATCLVPTFSEVPEIEVVIVNRVDQPCTEIVVPVTAPVASTIANANYDAIAARV